MRCMWIIFNKQTLFLLIKSLLFNKLMLDWTLVHIPIVCLYCTCSLCWVCVCIVTAVRWSWRYAVQPTSHTIMTLVHSISLEFIVRLPTHVWPIHAVCEWIRFCKPIFVWTIAVQPGCPGPCREPVVQPRHVCSHALKGHTGLLFT